MKKIVFLFCAAAMLGTMTSCHRSTDVSPNVTPVVVDQTRTLIVTTNTAADFTYEGKTVSNVTTATFTNVAAQGKLKITPRSTDYYDQDAMDIDFYDKLTLAINVNLAKKPSIVVSQEDAKNGQDVTNDTENQQSTEVVANLTVPPTTLITGSASPFSITTFVPAETVLESTEKGEEVEANVLVIRCTPDGARFSEPIVVNLGISNSSGFDLECVSEADENETLPMIDLGNNKWQVSFTHFSDWFVFLKAIVTESADREEVTNGSSAIVAGENTITYRAKAGAIETSSMRCVLVSTFIQKKFGAYFETTKKATFTSDAPGTATWRVTQPYKEVTLQSNTKTFTARVYGEPVIEITGTQSGQGGHSGGSVN